MRWENWSILIILLTKKKWFRPVEPSIPTSNPGIHRRMAMLCRFGRIYRIFSITSYSNIKNSKCATILSGIKNF